MQWGDSKTVTSFGVNLHLLDCQLSRCKDMHYLTALYSRLGMSVTTQGGSGRQYVTGSRRNISKYRFVLLNVFRFRET